LVKPPAAATCLSAASGSGCSTVSCSEWIIWLCEATQSTMALVWPLCTAARLLSMASSLWRLATNWFSAVLMASAAMTMATHRATIRARMVMNVRGDPS
jgi:hypothetical protein